MAANLSHHESVSPDQTTIIMNKTAFPDTQSILAEAAEGLHFPIEQLDPPLDQVQCAILSDIILEHPHRLANFLGSASRENMLNWGSPGWDAFRETLSGRLRSTGRFTYSEIIQSIYLQKIPGISVEEAFLELRPVMVVSERFPRPKPKTTLQAEAAGDAWEGSGLLALREGRILCFVRMGEAFDLIHPDEYDCFWLPWERLNSAGKDLFATARFLFSADLPARFRGEDPGGLCAQEQISKIALARRAVRDWSHELSFLPRKDEVIALIKDVFSISARQAGEIWTNETPENWRVRGTRKRDLDEATKRALWELVEQQS